jgi:hypothetical protein
MTPNQAIVKLEMMFPKYLFRIEQSYESSEITPTGRGYYWLRVYDKENWVKHQELKFIELTYGEKLHKVCQDLVDKLSLLEMEALDRKVLITKGGE